MTLVEAKASYCKSCAHMMKMSDRDANGLDVIKMICLRRSHKDKCEYRTRRIVFAKTGIEKKEDD